MTREDSPRYDEFGFLESYARHEGLPWRGPPEVRRRIVSTSAGFRMSGLVWRSDDEAQIVLLHGAIRSAHDEPSALWDCLQAMTASVMLVRGALSPYVHDDDQAEFARRRPGARMEVVVGAGHSVQSDRAAELATLIASISPQ